MRQIQTYMLHAAGSTGDSKFLQKMEILGELLRGKQGIKLINSANFQVESLDGNTGIFGHIQKNILECELLILVGTYEVIALGLALGIANSCNRVTLLCYEKGVYQSPFVNGSKAANPNLEIITYDSDLYEQIMEKVKSMLR